jgi:hypothetical protein
MGVGIASVPFAGCQRVNELTQKKLKHDDALIFAMTHAQVMPIFSTLFDKLRISIACLFCDLIFKMIV